MYTSKNNRRCYSCDWRVCLRDGGMRLTSKVIPKVRDTALGERAVLTRKQTLTDNQTHAPKRLLLAKRVRCEMRVMNLVTRLSRENALRVESRKSVSECLRCVKLLHIRAFWEKGATRELKGSSASLTGLKESLFD